MSRQVNEVLPVALIAHTIPNRTRLRIPARRGDAVFFASIATALSAMPGIRKVAVQPVTGSILIDHSKQLPKLLEAIADARLFRVFETEPPTQASHPSNPMAIDPRIIVGVGMAVFAVWQLTKGRILPPAITLGWYAANLAGVLANHGASPSAE